MPARPTAASGRDRQARSAGERLLQPLDAVDERVDRRCGVATGDPHERDLEREARVGRVGAAHVGDGVSERLERADEQRVAELRPQRAQARLLVFGEVDPHLVPGRGEHERVAQRVEEIVGDAAGLVAGVEQRRQRGERGADILGRDGLEDRGPLLERAAAERAGDLLEVESARARRERLVEERERVARRAAALTGDPGDRVGVGVDTLALAARR